MKETHIPLQVYGHGRSGRRKTKNKMEVDVSILEAERYDEPMKC